MAGLAAVQVSDLVVQAAAKIRVVRYGGTLEPGVAAGLVSDLGLMLDLWNADPAAKYTVGFQSFVPILGGHQPQTIGPQAADWLATIRPDRLQGANLILTTSSPVTRIPITIRDEQWWLAQSLQALTGAIVTDLYYANDWPNGACYLWPVPTVAYPIELLTDTLFESLAITDTLWLPPGYQAAVILSLAEFAAPGLGQDPSQELKDQAKNARVICFGNNVTVRPARTRDGGMPGGRRGGSYLYRTGGFK